jgi:hypothetical protein
VASLRQLIPPVLNVSDRRLLCNRHQKQHVRQERLLGHSGHCMRYHLYSDHCAERALHPSRLSLALAANLVQRSRIPTEVGLLDQQYEFTAFDHCSVVQKPPAGGIVFQMDQSAPVHQEVSCKKRERSQLANQLRSSHKRANCHC